MLEKDWVRWVDKTDTKMGDTPLMLCVLRTNEVVPINIAKILL